MRVESRLSRTDSVILLPPTGDRHEDNVPPPRLLPDLPAHVVPAHARQPDVEQNYIGSKLVGQPECLMAIVRDGGLVPPELQQHRQRRRSVLVIVDDEDATTCRAVGGLSRAIPFD